MALTSVNEKLRAAADGPTWPARFVTLLASGQIHAQGAVGIQVGKRERAARDPDQLRRW